MSLFDENDDSITELPLFARICRRSDNKCEIVDNLVPIVTTNEPLIQTTDKSNDTLTLDSDSDEEDIAIGSNHSIVSIDVSNDSIQVIYCSPDHQKVQQNNEVIESLMSEDIEAIDGNQSMASIDWTPIKPKFINRTPSALKRPQNRSKGSLKKSIDILNKTQTKGQKTKGREEREQLRNELKAQKEMSKLRERAHKEVLKSKNIKQSIKYCFAVIDTKLYEIIEQFLNEIFTKNECNYRLTDCPLVPMSVTWVRKCLNLVDDIDPISGQSSQSSVGDTEVKENHILVIIDANDFIQRVHSFINNIGETLNDLVKEVIEKSNIKNITLLVNKLEIYFKRQKTKSNNQFKQRFNELNAKDGTCSQNYRQSRRNSMPSVTREDVDLALIDLEVKLMAFDSQTKVSVIKAENSSDISTYIYRYTRSVAESMARREKNLNQNIGWFAEADNRGTVDPIDEESHHKLWKRQLMQFPKISYEIANAIASQYPTPHSLLNRYSRETKPELLLSEIVVSRRQANGTNTERKVGRELSARIHLFMTSRDCDQLLNNR